ncbi:MAG: KamA family radical SAM protein [Phycisphaerae bacterium]
MNHTTPHSAGRVLATNGERYRAITRSNVAQTRVWGALAPEVREAVTTVSTVLPFRTNEYVMRELIDWSRVPADPIFQLTFPQRGMLSDADYAAMRDLLGRGAPAAEIEREANRIRRTLNPHPGGQMTQNVPQWRGEPLAGVQHKYRETVLFFPSHGQTCHAYCTFCFRWAQFVGIDELKFSSREIEQLVGYLKEHREVTNVLFTGGDPMIMSAGNLRRYIAPLLDPALDHIHSIRIGTKSVAYWPQRFVSDADADDVLRLFEEVVGAGRHLALMAHYSHPVELSTEMSRAAVRRIRATGANIRMQSPVIRHVNDHPDVWVDLWKAGLRLGCVPYYVFVERDTGARNYFELPLSQCWSIYRRAYSRVSGLARTVRGPSMSATPGKVHVLGVSDFAGEKVFVLQYVQARNPKLVRRPFFAKFDPKATWFDQLEPATPADQGFFPHWPAAASAGPFVPLTTPTRTDAA